MVGALMSAPRTRTNCLSPERGMPYPQKMAIRLAQINGIRAALAIQLQEKGQVFVACGAKVTRAVGVIRAPRVTAAHPHRERRRNCKGPQSRVKAVAVRELTQTL